MGRDVLKIAFRVDAGNLIGTGHLIETLALMENMKQKMVFRPIFITHRDAFTLKKIKEAAVRTVKYVPDSIPEDKEADAIIRILGKEGCGHCVTDLLNRSNDFYGYLAGRLKTTCVILDNSEHREIPATLLVNFSITQKQEFYENAERFLTRYLIGPRYFPMKKSLRDAMPVRIRKKARSIFVNQGGSDPYGLTVKIISALEKACLKEKVSVVLGGALKDDLKKEIKILRSSLKGDYSFYSNLPQVKVYELMRKSDLAISAAGNLLYELAFLGIPTLVVSHHERHDAVANAFHKKGAAFNIGIGSAISEAMIKETVLRFMNDYNGRRSLARNAASLFAPRGEDALSAEQARIYCS